ncbi:MAG: response regulator [Verrucomicrobiia bacterium]
MKGKAKILIVENDTPVAMMMVNLLTRAGCDVMVANTGKKGMELAQENEFDLIALDMDLPDFNSFEICSDLKQRHLTRNTPIVFVSGKPCVEERQRGLELGAADYITKPLDPSDFARQILANANTKIETNGAIQTQ